MVGIAIGRESLWNVRGVATGWPSGGRTWRAHFEFTRINIEPIILRKKIEDARERATLGTRCGAYRE